MYIERNKEVWVQLQAVGLTPGISLYFQRIKVTKTHGFSANIACKWKGKYRGWTAEEGWFILTNLQSLDDALCAYQKRFGDDIAIFILDYMVKLVEFNDRLLDLAIACDKT